MDSIGRDTVQDIRTRPKPSFLDGGGEIARLIADFDWSSTPLGPLEDWSSTLRISVGLALRSPVPIVMLLGDDGVMIYNDAYSAFAGGRHPSLLGSKVREGWPEVADFNDNVMNVVLGGGTLTYRDQELTLYRHGRAEQVWLNLDYSPITDEAGQPVGVIAIVVETTEKVQAQLWLSAERERLRHMFEQAPGFIAMMSGPDHIIDLTNAAYMQLIGHRDVVGKRVRDALPEIVGQGFIELLDQVFNTGEAFVGNELRAVLQRAPGAAPEDRFVDFIYQPIRKPGGEVVGIFMQGSDITERVLAERAVRESAAQFRTFAEAMPNHVWTSQPSGMLDWFNSRTYEYGGALPGELDGEGWAAMVHPDDLPLAGRRWAEALQSGSPYETEFRLRRHDGQYRWHITRAVPITDIAGQLVRWIGTNTDIDDQRRTADRLAESEACLRLAIDAGQLAVWELDGVTGQVAPSPALNRLYGFPEDATPTTADYQSRYAPGEAERLAALGAAAAARGETEIEVEIRHLWPDGTEKWLLIRAQALAGRSAVIGVAIDVSERKRVERALQESERRLRLSQNAAGIASLELDIQTGTVLGSDQFWGLWGLSPRESVHISVLENIVVPEDKDIRSTPETRKAGTAPPSVEYRIRRPDNGALRWLSRHIEFVRDEAGNPITMYGIIQDVTEQKEARARQEMLMHELGHRVKNSLAMVSAIAAQTLRSSNLETAAAVFNERLRALASAHDLLTETGWTQTSMLEVLRTSTAVLPPDRLVLEGPDIALSPKMALTLALAVNELGTNALKYGALSNAEGGIRVTWRREAEGEGGPTLVWEWVESGGPPVVPPTRKGFGRFLIERALAADFSGKVDIEYEPEGIQCTLIAPWPTSAS